VVPYLSLRLRQFNDKFANPTSSDGEQAVGPFGHGLLATARAGSRDLVAMKQKKLSLTERPSPEREVSAGFPGWARHEDAPLGVFPGLLVASSLEATGPLTLGYGDVVPVLPVARSLAGLEAPTGMLYPPVLIGLLLSDVGRSRPNGP
jgi:hypothetical protein